LGFLKKCTKAKGVSSLAFYATQAINEFSRSVLITLKL